MVQLVELRGPRKRLVVLPAALRLRAHRHALQRADGIVKDTAAASTTVPPRSAHRGCMCAWLHTLRRLERLAACAWHLRAVRASCAAVVRRMRGRTATLWRGLPERLQRPRRRRWQPARCNRKVLRLLQL